MMSWLGLVAMAYLMGSISASILIVRLLDGNDIRQRGSRNAGASNVLRVVGRGPAVAVLLVDMAKGVVPVQIARSVDAPGSLVGAVAVAAVVGHMFPIFHGLRGGKGVATAAGALGSLAIRPAGLAAALFVTVAATTRYASLASLVAVTSFPLFLFLSGRAGWMPMAPGWLVASALVIGVLVILKHQDNIGRLVTGTEHRLGDVEPEETTV